MTDALLAPENGELPSYYRTAPIQVAEAAKFTDVGWEIGFYSLNDKNTFEHIPDEGIFDGAGKDTTANTGRERNYYGFRFMLKKVIRAEGIKLTSKLDSPSKALVSVPLGGEPVGILRDEVVPFRSAIEVSYNGHTMFGGIVWTCRADFFKQTLTIDASDFISFYAHRVSDHSRVSGEQGLKASMEQVEALWCCTAKVSNYNTGIHTAVHYKRPARPLLRDVDLGYGAFNKVMDSLYRWADNDTGFFVYEKPVRCGPSWMNDSQYRATTLNSNWHFTQSRAPRPLIIGGERVKLVDRQNCEVSDLFVDGSTYANYSYAVGIPARQSKWVPRAEAWRDPAIKPNQHSEPIKDVAVKYNLRVDDEDPKGKANLKLLQEKSQQQLTWGSEPSVLPTVRVYPDLFHPGWFKQANEGLTVELSSRNEYAQIEGEFVVMGSSIEVDKDGSSIIDLDLVQRSKFPT
ncbi:hypothetical protein ACFYYS_06220 [Streptomyces sp. NPDC002120]|uniref:hypothetical protein n=1 Tax=Streptomyces sp. NPDC002120 TaxID=3364631 RepID=UPI00369C2DD9